MNKVDEYNLHYPKSFENTVHACSVCTVHACESLKAVSNEKERGFKNYTK
jgi:hypothetical protein